MAAALAANEVHAAALVARQPGVLQGQVKDWSLPYDRRHS